MGCWLKERQTPFKNTVTIHQNVSWAGRRARRRRQESEWRPIGSSASVNPSSICRLLTIILVNWTSSSRQANNCATIYIRITVLASVTAVLISHHSTPYNFQCLTGAIRNVQPKHEDIDFSTMRLAPVLLFCFDSNLESLSFFVNLLGPKWIWCYIFSFLHFWFIGQLCLF